MHFSIVKHYFQKFLTLRDSLLPSAPRMSLVLRSEVHVTSPKEYWDYESIAVQWGYLTPTPVHFSSDGKLLHAHLVPQLHHRLLYSS